MSMIDNTQGQDIIKVEGNASPERRRWPIILTEVIMMSRNSMTSSSWLPLPSTRSLTTKPHDLNVFRHVENIKETLMSTTITTAYHILVEEKFNQSDTSCQTCQRPPWSSPPSYPPRPRCRWPPTHMYLWSVMLSWKHKKLSCHPPSQQHITSLLNIFKHK